MNPSLCDHCRLIFLPESFNIHQDDETVITEYSRTDTLPDLANLQKYGDLGCIFCTELSERISTYKWPDNARDISIGPATLLHESMWEAELTPEQEGISMIEVAVSSAQIKTTIRFDIFADPGSYASTHMRVRRRPPSTVRLSTKCIERLHDLIKQCAGVHWQCNPGDEEFWPTRVIDVGPADGSVDAKVVATSGKPEEYLALSHCWGVPGPGVRMLKTTTSTMKSHLNGIPLDSMPQNFQDAVFMTRALGSRYIWVDSLCIIQDCADDWAREGSQMDKIYKFARLTLAATSASTSEDGFLDYKLKDQTFTIPLTHCIDPSKVPSHSQHPLPCQIVAQHQETRSYDRMEPSVDDTIWNTRGWTLQERHLSRRILHFSQTQIFWECRRGFASECGQRVGRLPISMARVYGANDSSSESEYESSLDDNSEISLDDPIQNLVLDDRSVTSAESNTRQSVDEDTIKLRSGLYNWWFQVLADYTSRKLTFASDKFVAISGLAKELNTTFLNETGVEDTYLAGLWLGALSECLLWRPEWPVDTQRNSPKTDRAPSWSWGRWDVPCVPTADAWPRPGIEADVMDYVGHSVELGTGNKYGSIRSATLTVRGGLTEITRHDAFEAHGRILGYYMSLVGSQERIGVALFDRLDGHERAGADKLYAMQVMIQKVPVRDPAGLILRPVDVGGKYERVGVFQVDAEHLDIFSMVKKEVVFLV